MVKVIGGKYRSRNIEIPAEGTVPTKSRTREAIFSAIRNYLPGANCLDLFAGSGALGIEALSRGATSCLFVDYSPEAVAVIKKNLASLKETQKVLRADFKDALSSIPPASLDLVFLDPPYAKKEYYQQAIDLLSGGNLLKEESAVVIEYEGLLELDLSGFDWTKEYKYGYSKVIIAKKGNAK